MCLKFRAFPRAVADTGGTPLVVHGPYHRLAAREDFPQVLHGQHPLVYPVQVDDVRFLEAWQFGDVGARICRVYLEQAFLGKTVSDDDQESFVEKVMSFAPFPGNLEYVLVVGFLVIDQHASLRTVFVQGFHEPVGGDGGTAGTFGCVYDQNHEGLGNILR